jgi:hypothetical protein
MPNRYSSEDHFWFSYGGIFYRGNWNEPAIGVALPTKRLNGTQCVPLKLPASDMT